MQNIKILSGNHKEILQNSIIPSLLATTKNKTDIILFHENDRFSIELYKELSRADTLINISNIDCSQIQYDSAYKINSPSKLEAPCIIVIGSEKTINTSKITLFKIVRSRNAPKLINYIIIPTVITSGEEVTNSIMIKNEIFHEEFHLKDLEKESIKKTIILDPEIYDKTFHKVYKSLSTLIFSSLDLAFSNNSYINKPDIEMISATSIYLLQSIIMNTYSVNQIDNDLLYITDIPIAQRLSMTYGFLNKKIGKSIIYCLSLPLVNRGVDKYEALHISTKAFINYYLNSDNSYLINDWGRTWSECITNAIAVLSYPKNLIDIDYCSKYNQILSSLNVGDIVNEINNKYAPQMLYNTQKDILESINISKIFESIKENKCDISMTLK